MAPEVITKHASLTERENLTYLQSLGLTNVVPPFMIQDDYIFLETYDSIYGFFRLSNQFINWVYQNTLYYMYQHRQDLFSPGFYKYLTTSGNALLQPQLGESQITYQAYLISVLNEVVVAIPEIDSFCMEVYQYCVTQLTLADSWKPEGGYALLHGYLKLSNIVYQKKPLLINMDYMRYGAPEIELSHFLNQLIGIIPNSEKKIMELYRNVFSNRTCFGDIDYDYVRTIGIPLFLFLHYAYAKKNFVEPSNMIFRVYPDLWKNYKLLFL